MLFSSHSKWRPHITLCLLAYCAALCLAMQNENESQGGGNGSILANGVVRYLSMSGTLNNPMNAVRIGAGPGGEGPNGGGGGAMANVRGLYEPPQPPFPIAAAQVGETQPGLAGRIESRVGRETGGGKGRKKSNTSMSTSRKLLQTNQTNGDEPMDPQIVQMHQARMEYYRQMAKELNAKNSAIPLPDPGADIPEPTGQQYAFLDNVMPYMQEQKAVANNAPFGRLSVKNGRLVGANGQAVELRGIALMVSQWFPTFWTPQVVRQLTCTWNANVIRAAMGSDNGGYLQNPQAEYNRVVTVVDAAIQNGAYIVVDFHNTGDAPDPRSANYQNLIAQANKFFNAISARYKGVPNVLYELWNEPNHYKVGNTYVDITWSDILRYHNPIIDSIHKNDPNAVIIAGTPGWSSGPKGAVLTNPIRKNNVIYTLHWYTVGDTQNNKQRAFIALAEKRGIGTFVTEYGTTGLTATDPVDTKQVQEWWNFMQRSDIGVGYINWEMSNQKENTAALKPNCGPNYLANAACYTTSGALVFQHLQNTNKGVACYRRSLEEEENEKGNEGEKETSSAQQGLSKRQLKKMMETKKKARMTSKQKAKRRDNQKFIN